jgi:hypothetical protein
MKRMELDIQLLFMEVKRWVKDWLQNNERNGTGTTNRI